MNLAVAGARSILKREKEAWKIRFAPSSAPPNEIQRCLRHAARPSLPYRKYCFALNHARGTAYRGVGDLNIVLTLILLSLTGLHACHRLHYKEDVSWDQKETGNSS
jgi:hypothetical protein